MKVKGNANRFRLFLFLHPLQNVQKTINGMGVKPLTSRKGPDTKKRSIDDGVTVKDQKLHTFLHLAPWGVSIISMPRAFSSSRMRSASAQFLAFLASVR